MLQETSIRMMTSRQETNRQAIQQL